MPGKPVTTRTSASDWTLFDALRVLATAHTKDDHVTGFSVMPGADMMLVGHHDYFKAWRIVREQLHLQTEYPR